MPSLYRRRGLLLIVEEVEYVCEVVEELVVSWRKIGGKSEFIDLDPMPAFEDVFELFGGEDYLVEVGLDLCRHA